jgi:hypothetical protein
MKQKIFCIGFPKTGTKSMSAALKILGYSVTGPNGFYDPDIEKKVFAMADRLVRKYDAFQDEPWPVIYKEMDRKYPGSKFILMQREPQSWIQSQLKDFGSHTTPMRTWVYGYGCPKGNEEVYLKRYDEHNREVDEYFRNRPGDLLVMDLAKGEGWEKLCPFLGAAIPDKPFPHANRSSSSEIPLFRAMKKIQNRLEWLFS